MKHSFLLFSALLLIPQAQGESSLDSLKKTHQNLRATVQNLRQEKLEPHPTLSRIRERLVGMTGHMRTLDTDITQTQHQLNALEKERKTKEAALLVKDQDLLKSLRLIQRFSRISSSEHLLSQSSPQDVVHSAILLKSLQRHLYQETAALRQDLETIATQNQDLENKKVSIIKELKNMIMEASTLMGELKGERQKTEEYTDQLVLQPAHLESLLDALEHLNDPLLSKITGKPKIVKSIPFKTSEGTFTFPVTGQVVSPFKVDGLPLNKGIVLETEAGALLKAPFEGKVVFSGPLPRHGQLLVLEHKFGYHALLAGMETLKKTVGDQVKAGDCVAMMPTGAQVPPRLYLELHKKGTAIDPLLKFRTP